MRRILLMAWRNIWRNRRRTLINIVAISLALGLVIIYGGMVAGVVDDAKNQLDNAAIGHVEVSGKGWRAHRSSKLAMPAGVTVESLQLPAGAQASGRVVVRGLATSAHGTESAEVQGVDFARERDVAGYLVRLTEGEVPAADDARGIVVGDLMAEKLRLSVGKKVRLMAQRADGEVSAELFRVRGIYHSISSGVSKHRVLVTPEAARALAGVEGMHQIIVQLPVVEDTRAVASALKAQLGEQADVATFGELFPIYETLEQLTTAAQTGIALFVYLLVGLGILNTIVMSVLERTREFGVIQAIGTRPSGVLGLVLGESFWIATLATVVGLAFGLFVTWYGSTTSLFDYSAAMGEGFDYGGAVINSKFLTRVDVPSAVRSTVAVYLMALLVGLVPALRVARMKPVDAIHAR